MKVLIKYSDWCLLDRGEINPKVGDKIFLFNYKQNKLEEEEIISIDNYSYTNKLFFITDKDSELYPEECYVEIDYNPNEINEKLEEFREITNKHFDKLSSKLAIDFVDWLKNNTELNLVSTEELFKQFKNTRK